MLPDYSTTGKNNLVYRFRGGTKVDKLACLGVISSQMDFPRRDFQKRFVRLAGTIEDETAERWRILPLAQKPDLLVFTCILLDG